MHSPAPFIFGGLQVRVSWTVREEKIEQLVKSKKSGYGCGLFSLSVLVVGDTAQHTQSFFLQPVIKYTHIYQHNIIFGALETIFAISLPWLAGMLEIVIMGNQIRVSVKSGSRISRAVSRWRRSSAKPIPARSSSQCNRLQV